MHAGEIEIKPTFEATFGAFSSGKSYNGENLEDERVNWQEGHLKYGAKETTPLKQSALCKLERY